MNTIFNNLKITVFGESHSEYMGITIDSLSPGIKINEEYIKECLFKRRPEGLTESSRIEKDDFKIVSGMFNGYTTGTPLTILIPNKDTDDKVYEEYKDLMRPSHADYTQYVKYHGYNDYRGGGMSSGRLTSVITAGGAIVLEALEKIGIQIGCHILECQGLKDDKFSLNAHEIEDVNNKDFPLINDGMKEPLMTLIKTKALEGDSLGGTIECAITGLPAGLGEPMFDSLESEIAHAVFSIPAVKGIEFGAGFHFKDLYGSEANDPFYLDNGSVKTKTNNNGGINGGISNSMPVVFDVVMKPAPSIKKAQETVNIETNKNATIEIKGRHDPFILRRANIVLRSMTSFVILDALMKVYGNNVLKEGFNK